MARKVSKASKRRLLLLGTISAMIIVYFIYSAFSYFGTIAKLSNEEQKLKQYFAELKETEETLKIEIQKLNDPDYVARFARENFLYSKDGEYIIRFDETKTVDALEENSDSPKGNMLPGFFLLSLVTIVILVLRKKKKKSNANLRTSQ